MNTKTSTILALLGGAAIGAIIALMFAPGSGRKTRKKIRRMLKAHGVDLSAGELTEFISRFKPHHSK